MISQNYKGGFLKSYLKTVHEEIKTCEAKQLNSMELKCLLFIYLLQLWIGAFLYKFDIRVY